MEQSQLFLLLRMEFPHLVPLQLLESLYLLPLLLFESSHLRPFLGGIIKEATTWFLLLLRLLLLLLLLLRLHTGRTRRILHWPDCSPICGRGILHRQLT